jgi:hypothetical protein
MANETIPDDPNWDALVSRTRLLMRAVGLVEFDDSFQAPERFCGLEVQSPADVPIPDLRKEQVFREYLHDALAILTPIGALAAHQLRDALNARLADPVTTIELQRGERSWDLLSPDTYSATHIAQDALMAIIEHLGWPPEPDPSSPSPSPRRGPSR